MCIRDSLGTVGARAVGEHGDLGVWGKLVAQRDGAGDGPVSYTHLDVYKRQVLGFRRGEVHHYVNKETLIIAAIGAALGVPLVSLLAEGFTYMLQMPSLYFDVEVEPLSYVLAVMLSFVFTLSLIHI